MRPQRAWPHRALRSKGLILPKERSGLGFLLLGSDLCGLAMSCLVKVFCFVFFLPWGLGVHWIVKQYDGDLTSYHISLISGGKQNISHEDSRPYLCSEPQEKLWPPRLRWPFLVGHTLCAPLCITAGRSQCYLLLYWERTPGSSISCTWPHACLLLVNLICILSL